MLVDLHKNREPDDFVIVGVHAAGTPEEQGKKMMRDFGMEYPICIDQDDGSGAMGRLFKAYRIQALPQAYIVDPEGTISAQGTLAEAMSAARVSVKKNRKK